MILHKLVNVELPYADYTTLSYKYIKSRIFNDNIYDNTIT